MAKLILMQAVQVLLSVMVIFGSDQKKSGENVFIIYIYNVLLVLALVVAFMLLTEYCVYLLSWILKKQFCRWDRDKTKVFGKLNMLAV